MKLFLEDDFDYEDYEDPYYNFNEEIGKDFEKELSIILNDLIVESDNLGENFTSNGNSNIHYKKHCLEIKYPQELMCIMISTTEVNIVSMRKK